MKRNRIVISVISLLTLLLGLVIVYFFVNSEDKATMAIIVGVLVIIGQRVALTLMDNKKKE